MRPPSEPPAVPGPERTVPVPGPTSHAVRAGRQAGLLCAGLAALAAVSVWGVLVGGTGMNRLGAWAPQLAVAAGVLGASGFWLGGRLAPRVLRPGLGGVGVGSAFAVGTLGAATLAGSAVSLLRVDDGFAAGVGPALNAWVAKPLFWSLLVGGVPAVLLGWLYVAMVRRRAHGG